MPKSTLSFYLHIIAIAVVIAALWNWAFSGGGIAPTVAAKQTAYERIMQTQTIRCGYVLYPPYVLKDANTGQLSGAFYDIVNEMARRQKLKVEWGEEVGWATFISGLQAERYDLVCSGGWNSANEGRLIAYSIPAYYSAVNVYVRPDDTRFDADAMRLNDPQYTFVSTDGSLLGVMVGEDFPKAKLISLPNLSDIGALYETVVTGKADAVLTENYAVQQYLKNNSGKLKNITAQNPVRVYPTSPVIMPNNDIALQNTVNAGIAELVNTGFVDKTLDKYELGAGVGLRAQKPYQY